MKGRSRAALAAGFLLMVACIPLACAPEDGAAGCTTDDDCPKGQQCGPEGVCELIYAAGDAESDEVSAYAPDASAGRGEGGDAEPETLRTDDDQPGGGEGPGDNGADEAPDGPPGDEDETAGDDDGAMVADDDTTDGDAEWIGEDGEAFEPGDPDDDSPPEPEDWPCMSSDACPEPATCNLASGLCEPRATLPGLNARILNIYPTVAGPGDLIVLDGEGFHVGVFTSTATTVNVGGHLITTWSGLVVDENRVVFPLPEGVFGMVSLQAGGSGEVTTADETIENSLEPNTVNACGYLNPPAPGMPGETPIDQGPYAVGFTDSDTPDSQTRIYYPARCGGLRTPPSDGAFPFVLILHGDGAGHINYEYLARHLASWGYLSAMPPSESGEVLVQVLDAGLDAPETWFDALEGRAAGGEAVIVGHSKGSQRTEYVIFDENETRVAGIVFLGPVNQGYELPVSTLLFAASGDWQAFPWAVHGLWEKQPPPKFYVLIEGGNHSQFSDGKHWEGGIGDDYPTMARNRQFVIVQSLVLPFVQRCLGRDEPFADWLDAPEFPGEISFESEP